MCDFCENIYTENKTEILLREASMGEWIEKDNTGFNLVSNTGDPYVTGYIMGVKFCPYCGKALNESSVNADIRFNNKIKENRLLNSGRIREEK